MRLSIVHAADLHLDSPLVGLSRYEGAPVAEVRGATRRALQNLVSLCIDEEARLLLLAGDLYDGDWRDYSTGLFFAAQMARLREVGTQVVWIRGNHDAQSKITRHLALGTHCHELSSKRPETRLFEELGVAVHGQGFFSAAVTDDLSSAYPEPTSGALNIGLLHTSLSGRRGHAPYAPCDVQSLIARGYDYWALGHVHQRELVHDQPYIVFPGNVQGRHVRETGEKGATLIQVQDGSIVSVQHRSLDVVRFAQLTLDASRADTLLDVAQLLKAELRRALESADGRLVAARVFVRGQSRAHAELARDPERAKAQLQSAANEIQGGDAWLEDIRIDTEAPIDRKALAQRDDAVGQLVRSLQAVEQDDAVLATLVEELREIMRVLPAELRDPQFGLDLQDSEQARELVSSAGRMLLPRLLGL